MITGYRDLSWGKNEGTSGVVVGGCLSLGREVELESLDVWWGNFAWVQLAPSRDT